MDSDAYLLRWGGFSNFNFGEEWHKNEFIEGNAIISLPLRSLMYAEPDREFPWISGQMLIITRGSTSYKKLVGALSS